MRAWPTPVQTAARGNHPGMLLILAGAIGMEETPSASESDGPQNRPLSPVPSAAAIRVHGYRPANLVARGSWGRITDDVRYREGTRLVATVRQRITSLMSPSGTPGHSDAIRDCEGKMGAVDNLRWGTVKFPRPVIDRLNILVPDEPVAVTTPPCDKVLRCAKYDVAKTARYGSRSLYCWRDPQPENRRKKGGSPIGQIR